MRISLWPSAGLWLLNAGVVCTTDWRTCASVAIGSVWPSAGLGLLNDSISSRRCSMLDMTEPGRTCTCERVASARGGVRGVGRGAEASGGRGARTDWPCDPASSPWPAAAVSAFWWSSPSSTIVWISWPTKSSREKKCTCAGKGRHSGDGDRRGAAFWLCDARRGCAARSRGVQARGARTRDGGGN